MWPNFQNGTLSDKRILIKFLIVIPPFCTGSQWNCVSNKINNISSWIPNFVDFQFTKCSEWQVIMWFMGKCPFKKIRLYLWCTCTCTCKYINKISIYTCTSLHNTCTSLHNTCTSLHNTCCIIYYSFLF